MQCLVESAKLTSQWPILCIRRSICRPRKETYAYPGHVGKGERPSASSVSSRCRSHPRPSQSGLRQRCFPWSEVYVAVGPRCPFASAAEEHDRLDLGCPLGPGDDRIPLFLCELHVTTIARNRWFVMSMFEGVITGGEQHFLGPFSGPPPQLDVTRLWGGITPRPLKLHRKTKSCLKLCSPGTTAAEEGGEPP
jgi:hypothetical protein